MRHALSETLSGLRRNTGMTLAVIVTMWVSLSLFGAGLLAAQQVELLKGEWYDKIEISIFLCTKDTPGENCEAGQDTTDDQRSRIEQAIRSNPEVEDCWYESKESAFAQFQDTYQDSPIQESLTVDQMQDSFRVKLRDPQEYAGLVSQIRSLPGVQNVQDLHQYLDPIFRWLSALQWGTIALSVLLLLAAALQISNTIRMATFTRGKEIGIMRLVGASNFYIMVPFLLESLVAALIGAVLAGATLALGVWLVIIRNAQVTLKVFRWISWSETGITIAAVVIVAIVLSVIPTLVSSRRYLRV
ncbi:MAG: permease-like cell division protein FtsX [Propionibacteriaceae bacterium]|jgi:cell division transport system permease protein|nr:permease-like cell division protein FtsX [Propionibacteriaceae bacterium]